MEIQRGNENKHGQWQSQWQNLWSPEIQPGVLSLGLHCMSKTEFRALHKYCSSK